MKTDLPNIEKVSPGVFRNTNEHEGESYKLMRIRRKQDADRVRELEMKISNINNDISNIKDMLVKLLEK